MRTSVRKAVYKFTHKAAGKFYKYFKYLLEYAAYCAFCASVGSIQGPTKIHHPFYLLSPQLIRIGAGFWAGPWLRLEAICYYGSQQFEPEIIIGNNVSINYFCHIAAINKVVIGDDVLIGSHVLITDHSHGDPKTDDAACPPRLRPLTSKGPVTIERKVWIGDGVRILSGVRIGESAIIGANAVVTHDVEAGCIVVGIPAKEIVRGVATNVSHFEHRR